MRTDEKEILQVFSQGTIRKYKEERERKTFFNYYLINPVLRQLIGNLQNKKLLDIGCGYGLDLELYKKEGAQVVGIDINIEMIRIAKANPSLSNVPIFNRSIYDLQFNNEFDYCVANLVLDQIFYIELAFRNVNHALKSGGIFFFSVVHPLNSATCGYSKELTDYFSKDKDYYKPKSLGKKLPYYHRTFQDYFSCAEQTGFKVESLVEPQPVTEAQTLFPDDYQSKIRVPEGLIMKLRKQPFNLKNLLDFKHERRKKNN